MGPPTSSVVNPKKGRSHIQSISAPRPSTRTNLRAAVRRLFALDGEGNRGVSLFHGARNLRIQQATFTITQYGGIQAGTVAASSSSTSSTHQSSSNPRRENPDVYVDCMLSEKKGYPLWTPSPNLSLPVLHRTLGVSLGDVGVLNLEGGFDFLFNILHDASHPINTIDGVCRTPEGFAPFEQLKRSETWEHVDCDAGSYISHPYMTRVDNGGGHVETVLRSTQPEAAVLMVPEDIHGTRMNITVPLMKYVEENTTAWYTFVKVTLGRMDIQNGDLRVVYGCRKSIGFGMATTFNDTQLTFSKDSTWAQMSGCAYHWNHTGSADAKAGPRRQETPHLHSNKHPRNQCLFISTIDTKVSAKIWKGIIGLEIGTPADKNLHPTLDRLAPPDGSSRHSANKSSNTKGKERAFTSHGKFHERVFHPSIILHNILEIIAPGLPVYIVYSDNWAPYISSANMDVRDFVSKVLEEKSIVEYPGMAYFTKGRDENLIGALAKIEFEMQKPYVNDLQTRIERINFGEDSRVKKTKPSGKGSQTSRVESTKPSGKDSQTTRAPESQWVVVASRRVLD